MEALNGSRSRDLEALKMVFFANDELGRLVRERVVSGIGWTDLQIRLNAVTISLKRGKDAEALATFDELELMLRGLLEAARARSQKEFIDSDGPRPH